MERRPVNLGRTDCAVRGGRSLEGHGHDSQDSVPKMRKLRLHAHYICTLNAHAQNTGNRDEHNSRRPTMMQPMSIESEEDYEKESSPFIVILQSPPSFSHALTNGSRTQLT